MIEGAARALVVGDPREIATHVGPVIDTEAKEKLDKWTAAHASRVIFRHDGAPPSGTYVAPTIVALDRARDLTEEVFGPVLHVVRWRAAALDVLIDDIAANGYGLTLGIHSRIDDDRGACRGAARQRQRLRQPQHDRRRGRHAAVRRQRSLRYRPESRRPELPATFRHRAGRHGEHVGCGRQCEFAGRG